MHRNALIIFARKPETGKVKTRLAATLGDARALEIYRRLLLHTRAIAQGASHDVHVFLTAPADDDFWDGCTIHLQEGPHLGARMHRAFSTLFAQDYQKAVIIGSDCPDLSAADLDDAFLSLDHHDVVIGPAKDGGYYLLGMRTLYLSLFEAEDWSHDRVFSRTMEAIVLEGATAHILRDLQDVDEEADVPGGWL